MAATLCVNPGATNGCYGSIKAAVQAASPTDTVNVAKGTYKETVIIDKALSLIGADRNSTIIDASGLANGVYVDGLDYPGISNVAVKGFKIQNANFEGILLANVSNATIVGNWVINNDKALNVTDGTCPGLPSFETSEGFDCGEGIHVMGADHSIIANNTSESNSGGILISDETAQTHDNVIVGNVVRNNAADCGITMASHPPAAISNSSVPLGIMHNTVANNQVVHNGYNPANSGSGVGIFSPVTGGTVSGNVVIGNTIMNNGLPGVAFHAHAPGQFLNDNMIIANQISGNGADTDDAFTPGPTGINVYGASSITGAVIAENVIQQESYDIVVNTPAQVDINLNNLGATVGVDNLGTGTADAVLNWWGCASGPGASGCASVGGAGVLFAPWLTQPFTP